MGNTIKNQFIYQDGSDYYRTQETDGATLRASGTGITYDSKLTYEGKDDCYKYGLDGDVAAVANCLTLNMLGVSISRESYSIGDLLYFSVEVFIPDTETDVPDLHLAWKEAAGSIKILDTVQKKGEWVTMEGYFEITATTNILYFIYKDDASSKTGAFYICNPRIWVGVNRIVKLLDSNTRKEWKRVTHEMVFGAPSRMKNIYRIKMTSSGTDPVVYYSLDDGAWTAVSLSDINNYLIGDMNVKGYTIKFKFEGDSDTVVSNMVVQYRIAGRI